ncbi:(Fe-S)-binding protein [Chloroflexota bacterium]
MSATSITYLGIPGYVLFWALFAIAFGLFSQRIYFLVRLMRLGREDKRFEGVWYRFKSMLVESASQWCSLKNVSLGRRINTVLAELFPQGTNLMSGGRRDLAGIGHALLFFGFGVMLIGYIIFIGLAEGFGLHEIIIGTTFETVYSSIMDIAAVFVIIVIIWAAIRRYVVRPDRLVGEISAEASFILLMVFSLMVLHVAIEGFGYAAANISTAWPPLGGALASFLSGTAISQGTLEAVSIAAWWLHYVIIIGFLVFIPYSKHLHLLASFPNLTFRSLSPKGALKPIDLEKVETFGVPKIQEFTWKDLLDLYACTVCGQCHVACPVQVSGKTLSPREIILNLKEHLLEVGSELLKNKGKPEASPANPDRAMIGSVVTEDEIWACTTCRACQEICPVGIEQMTKVVDMRRNLVMEQAVVPETAEVALRSIEDRGHPWRGATATRTDWTAGLDIKVMSEDSDVDILYWVGCTSALEERSMRVAQALAKVLKLAGINFGILGPEESCCGDPVRRLGNEYLFQMQAEKNIELMKGYGIKKIVTACPHCYNSVKNEYPQFGGEFEVIHHTEFIADLLREDKLRIIKGASGVVTYHDACYLGRYNNIYKQPREILNNIPDLTLVEMERNQRRGFCCGGGGGRMWMEERGTRISEMRTDEVIATKAQVVATACPFCLQMFDDAIKAKEAEGSLKVMDVAELVAGSAIYHPQSS